MKARQNYFTSYRTKCLCSVYRLLFSRRQLHLVAEAVKYPVLIGMFQVRCLTYRMGTLSQISAEDSLCTNVKEWSKYGLKPSRKRFVESGNPWHSGPHALIKGRLRIIISSKYGIKLPLSWAQLSFEIGQPWCVKQVQWDLVSGVRAHQRNWQLQRNRCFRETLPISSRQLVSRLAGSHPRKLMFEVTHIIARVWSCGFCGGQSGAGAGFLRVLRFPLSIFIPPIAPQSHSSIIWGLYSRPEVAAVRRGLSPTPVIIISISVCVYLRANLTAQRPITKLARVHVCMYV
jgi:hypothetical protein